LFRVIRHSGFVIPWVFGCFVIRHLWRAFIPFCLSQTRLSQCHSPLTLLPVDQRAGGGGCGCRGGKRAPLVTTGVFSGQRLDLGDRENAVPDGNVRLTASMSYYRTPGYTPFLQWGAQL